MDNAGEKDEESRPAKRRKITALADGEGYQSASNGTSRVEIPQLSAASREDADFFDFSERDLPEIYRFVADAADREGNQATSNASLRVEVGRSDDAYKDDDPFSDLSETDLAEIDRIVADAADRAGSQAASNASLPVEVGRSDNVYKDDDPFSDLSETDLAEVDRIVADAADRAGNQATSNASLRVEVGRADDAHKDDDPFSDLSETDLAEIDRIVADAADRAGSQATSNASLPVEVGRSDDAYRDDDPFSDLSETDLAEIDRIVVDAANREGHQATSNASLRIVGGRSDNVDKDDDSFSDFSDSALSEIGSMLARARDPQQHADALSTCDELSDLSEGELHGAACAAGSVDRQGQSLSSRRADQKARNLRLARSVYDVPNTWPPPHDLGVYSHGHAVTAAEYKVYLTKVGLHHNLFYNAIGGRASRSSWTGKFPYDKEHLGEGDYSEGNIFGRPPSPDTWPFLAFDDDPMFRSGAYKLLEGSGVCVQSRFCSSNGKRTARVYIELSTHQADKLALDEQRENLSVKRRNEILKKIEILNPPPSSFRNHVKKARSNGRLSAEGLRRELRSIHDDGYCADYIKAELQPFLQGDDQQQDLRRAMGQLVNGGAPLFWEFDESVPLFLLKGERTLIDGEKAVLPPPSKLCLAVNYEEHQRPTYVRLNSHQATQLSRQEQCFLGLRPNWITSSMSPLELYKFGLLPPGSRALENALTSDHEIREYFEKYPLKRLNREDKGPENEASSRSRQTIAEQQPPQKYDARSRERSPHTR